MEERGVEVDDSTLNRSVLKYAPLLEREFRARKRSVGRSWPMDETVRDGQRGLEVLVSSCRQIRRHCGFPPDRQAGEHVNLWGLSGFGRFWAHGTGVSRCRRWFGE
jgi:hypothetical protein